MTRYADERLLALVPAIYRTRDVEDPARAGVLHALLSVIAEQARVVERDVGQLYDNWFIETCEDWIVPYLGDLLGVRVLHGAGGAGGTRRAQVANTLRHRRRKGTATMLEQLARDATGWPARAVELFQLLGTTQHLNHVRPGNHRTPDLRRSDALELVDSPFDTVAHAADVRRIASGRGRHNIHHVGLFLWRLTAYPVDRVTAFALGDGRFAVSPLGHDMPLFNVPEREPDVAHLAGEAHVPGPLRRRPLHDELEERRARLARGETAPDGVYFAERRVVRIFEDDVEIPPERILVCDLTDHDRRPPPSRRYPGADGSPVELPIRVALDPTLGRMSFPAGLSPQPVVLVSYAYGFAGEIGGGPYDRRATARAAPATVIRVPQDEATIAAAIARWQDVLGRPDAVIEIGDDRTYRGPLTLAMTDTTLVVRAANETRPVVIGDVSVTGGTPRAMLTLDGLTLAGRVTVSGTLGDLRLAHATLVPGGTLRPDGGAEDPARASLGVAGPNEHLQITIEHSIVGPLRVPETIRGLRITDSIVDSPAAQTSAPSAVPAVAADDAGHAGPSAELERATVFGRVHVRELTLVSDTVLTDPVVADRRQAGCTRFSYVPAGSQVPRRYRCQPDLAIQEATADPALDAAARAAIEAALRLRIRPSFTDRRYGRPGYAQLAAAGSKEIRSGGHDDGEMGAFHALERPRREASLRAALDEYLRFGLEAGIFFAT